jgi:hypothetical protein
MPDKKRTVILFGSGALKGWGGTQTDELTEIVTKSGPEFILKDKEGTKLMKFIYNTFIDSGYKEKKDINFETLINAIEELIIYYSYYNQEDEKNLPSFLKVLFTSKYENQILNFSKIDNKKNNYRLQIPENIEYVFAKTAKNNESPEQFYFQHLLETLLTGINSKVSSYSYHSKNKSKIFQPENSIINKHFQYWIKNLSEHSIIRIYTLNYDRIFKILTEDIGLNIFEGFSYEDSIPISGVSPDIKKILTDLKSNIHYNLHGSSYWNVNARNPRTQLISPYITLHPHIKFSINNVDFTSIQMERGKNIVLSNIITGYQKTQKSAVTPYKQMQASFDRDCCIADEILIIGYSFGDSHINSSINTALISNKTLKLHIIDPAYCEKKNRKGYDLLINRIIHIFPEILNFKRNTPKYSNNKDTCTYFNGKLTVSSIGFDEFLGNY